MPDVSAVRVSPTWAVPLMVGAPVAGLLVSAGAGGSGSKTVCESGILTSAASDASPRLPKKSTTAFTRYT